MKTITFYGTSDDLPTVEVSDGSGKVNSEEYDGGKRYFRLHSNLTQQSVNVWVKYGVGDSDTWGAAPYLRREGDTLPDWNFRYRQEHGYSVALVMDAPDDTVVLLER